MFKYLTLIAVMCCACVVLAAPAPKPKADPHHFFAAAPVVTYSAYTPYVAAAPYAVLPSAGYISPYSYYGGLGYEYSGYPYAATIL